ncbi:MAG: ferrochelatase [Marinosulfonomonas sp.]|nr:ferrochelatase [Marinosulfonomonas sp.]
MPDPHAPKPADEAEKIGVLLANLGTPDATDYWSMRRYLSEFLSDQRVVDYSPWLWQPLLQTIILARRPFKSGAAYRTIWNNEANESPLLTITKAQTTAIAARLADIYGPQVEVDFCMRYGNPSIASKVQAMLDNGCRKILFFPLYPQYAGATTATANDQFFRALQAPKWQPATRTVAPYFDDPGFIDALATSVKRTYAAAKTKPETLVVSYHGLPQRHVSNGDPYFDHCQKTTLFLQKRLGWADDQITMAFQSNFGAEKWLQPYTVDVVAQLAQSGKRNIAVIAPGFAADCIETLEEIEGEIRESFETSGGKEFSYIPCLNDDLNHIDALVQIIDKNLAGWV